MYPRRATRLGGSSRSDGSCAITRCTSAVLTSNAANSAIVQRRPFVSFFIDDVPPRRWTLRYDAFRDLLVPTEETRWIFLISSVASLRFFRSSTSLMCWYLQVAGMF